MTLENYIKDLLYRYNCVIVPDFGAFILNPKSAIINKSNFTPPFKQITFNSLIQNNDGLLANHIAKTDKMPYGTALNFIAFEIEVWINTLLDEDLTLEGIGVFSLIEDNIHFEADTSINYLTSSFGLSPFISNTVTREVVQAPIVVNNNISTYKEQVEVLEEQAPIYINQEKREKSTYFLKYAAVFLIGASIVGLLGKKAYDLNLEQKQIIALQEQQTSRENEIQTATFVINSPLPTITLNTIEPINNLHIIAGSFRNKSNAHKKVKQLTKKGYNASIVGQNKWNLTQVAIQSFSNLDEANQNLAIIKATVAKDAWLLIKK